jgi:hypothetical protein
MAALCPQIQRLLVPFREGFIKLRTYSLSSGALSKGFDEAASRIHEIEEDGMVYQVIVTYGG